MKPLFKIAKFVVIFIFLILIIISCNDKTNSPDVSEVKEMRFYRADSYYTTSGKIITISGSNLDSINYVTVGDTLAELLQKTKDSVKILIPILPTDNYEIKGYNNTRFISLYNKITINNSSVSTTSFVPTDFYPTICSENDTLNLYGINCDLLKDFEIYIARTKIDKIISTSKTKIRLIIPLLNPYNPEIWIFDHSKDYKYSQKLKVVEKLDITTFSPYNGVPGDTAIINGAGFIAKNIDGLWLDNSKSKIIKIESNNIKFVVPNLPKGNYPINLVSYNSIVFTKSTFEVLEDINFSLSKYNTTSFDTITCYGKRFLSEKLFYVFFNDKRASVEVINDSTGKFVVPALSTGKYKLKFLTDKHLYQTNLSLDVIEKKPEKIDTLRSLLMSCNKMSILLNNIDINYRHYLKNRNNNMIIFDSTFTINSNYMESPKETEFQVSFVGNEKFFNEFTKTSFKLNTKNLFDVYIGQEIINIFGIMEYWSHSLILMNMTYKTTSMNSITFELNESEIKTNFLDLKINMKRAYWLSKDEEVEEYKEYSDIIKLNPNSKVTIKLFKE